MPNLEEKPSLEQKKPEELERVAEEKEKAAEVPLPEKKMEVPKPEVGVPPAVPPAPPVTPPPAEVSEEVKKLKSLDEKHQVKVLTDLAFQKGLGYAIQVARNLDNAYVLDEFHDTLVDELYKQLVEGKKLKEL